MRIFAFSLNCLLFIVCTVSVADTIDILKFDSLEQQSRYTKLTQELRCLKCQNSSIAGSNASLAKDLRLKVHQQIVQQKMSDDEIKNWMKDRYGDFVLYEPPLNSSTLILWLLPLLLLLAGLFMLAKRLAKKPETTDLSDSQKDKLEQLLNP